MFFVEGGNLRVYPLLVQARASYSTYSHMEVKTDPFMKEPLLDLLRFLFAGVSISLRPWHEPGVAKVASSLPWHNGEPPWHRQYGIIYLVFGGGCRVGGYLVYGPKWAVRLEECEHAVFGVTLAP